MSDNKEKLDARNIKREVAEKLKTSGPTVVEGVISSLVEKELENRKNLVSMGIAKLEELDKEGKKIKPDNISYNEKGEEQSSGWSKSALENKQKHEQKVAKLEKALDAALNNNDYAQLAEAIK